MTLIEDHLLKIFISIPPLPVGKPRLTACCMCVLSKVGWKTDETRSQVWVYSYLVRGLCHIEGIENLTHALIKLGRATKTQRVLLQHSQSISSHSYVEHMKLTKTWHDTTEFRKCGEWIEYNRLQKKKRVIRMTKRYFPDGVTGLKRLQD